jgi:7-keto-8-aminopelargonate synthetase-like enzyme
MDVFQKCRDSASRTIDMRARGVYPYYRTISSAQDPVVLHQGRKLVMLGSNNYLGLTNHPEVKEAAARALAAYGTGCAGSRLLNGTLDVHVRLEQSLAEFLSRPAVLVFSTGYQVNLGVLSCLLGRSDIAFLDSLDHACIIDGSRLGFGRHFKFRHNDVGDLEKKLANAPADRGKLIVVDGVFSMEGDLAPLPELVELKNRYGARLMVDDAHGLGVFGQYGRGTPEHFGVEHEVEPSRSRWPPSAASSPGRPT